MRGYIELACLAADHGYRTTFVVVAVIAALAGALVAWLVHRPDAAGV